ncbi:MAG: glycosyltransferase family 2 protein [Bdellovibrionales bacterium]|nr:glycosyltransferase family 2 protein [Bdellovibrionales bacterium]
MARAPLTNIVRVPLSAIVLTHQSDRTLDSVLSALTWCDEIVVVDSGSKDKSIEIAKKYGANVLTRAFDGYGPQKKYAVEQAKNDWVFVVDSDEVVTPELQREIVEMFAAGYPAETIVGYEVQIKLVFLKKAMNYSGTGNKFHLRLFNRKFGNFNVAFVHENVEINGSLRHLKHPMLHYSYLTVEDYFNKFNTYTTFAAQDMAKKNKRISLVRLFTSFQAHFITRFIFRLGFLDGYHGFLWSLFSAMYPSVKYAKLIELKKSGDAF